MLNLEGSPYYIPDPDIEKGLSKQISKLNERISLLRNSGKLNEATLRQYYGDKRIEQVAESNAIEGSTLSVGETELAILKGVTLTGHDPAWVKSAQTLDNALKKLAEIARTPTPTNIEQLKEIHSLILEGSPVAGIFRNHPVRISGSKHSPPDNWNSIIKGMEDWENWSRHNEALPPILRAVVLHSWLTHIHPFSDGNGRTARAISNLELIRHGFPPLIIRKNKDRDRYIDALHESDEANLAPIFDLFADRLSDSLMEFERAATKAQGYDPQREKIRKALADKIHILESAIELLGSFIRENLNAQAGNGNLDSTSVNIPKLELDVEDFEALHKHIPLSNKWCFRIFANKIGLNKAERLAWMGFRSSKLEKELGKGPSIFWSKPNPEKFPAWIKDEQGVNGIIEFTLDNDNWKILNSNGDISNLPTSKLSEQICNGIITIIAA